MNKKCKVCKKQVLVRNIQGELFLTEKMGIANVGDKTEHICQRHICDMEVAVT